MASIYARYLSGEWGRYGHRSPDVKHCSALFDERLEKELMNLGDRVFDQPPSHMAVLMFAHSKPDAVYEFLETVAGSNANHWAKIILNVMALWEEGGVSINQEVIHRVPPTTLAKAHGFLKGADMTGWSEYESRAAEGFVEQWLPPGNPD
jgi:hypothetical protein